MVGEIGSGFHLFVRSTTCCVRHVHRTKFQEFSFRARTVFFYLVIHCSKPVPDIGAGVLRVKYGNDDLRTSGEPVPLKPVVPELCARTGRWAGGSKGARGLVPLPSSDRRGPKAPKKKRSRPGPRTGLPPKIEQKIVDYRRVRTCAHRSRRGPEPRALDHSARQSF